MAEITRPRNGKPTNTRRTAASSVYEKDDNVVIPLEMPGVKKDDLDLRIEENRLLIHGDTPGGADGTYLIRERQHGAFHMEYTIDETIDRDKVSAELKNGVLQVVLERKQSEKPKLIKVKVN
jgi:HSP20 family protein